MKGREIMSFSRAEKLLERAIGKKITQEDVETVISWPGEDLSLLFAVTDRVRRHYFADAVEPCAIMNIKSGGCSEDCAFCSQSAHNDASVTVQALSGKEEILTHYHQATSKGLKFGVVSSGKRLSSRDIIKLADALRECDGPVHASLGILSEKEFDILTKAGVVCYNHNLETSRNFFSQIVTTHTYDDRVSTIKKAKTAGMRTCCGGIFGLGESWNDRADLFAELHRLDVDTIPINFINSIPGTKIAPPGESSLEFLKIISLCRIILPDKIIKVCGGREINLGKLQGLMFYAGANGYISGDYLTTKGDSVESDDKMVEGLGLRKGMVDEDNK
ncbi:MAG: biotin synthase BioB [Chitinivibrionales bacterium]|nr:biotin synthase BioB [Chitinivibrionales bacterium]